MSLKVTGHQNFHGQHPTKSQTAREIEDDTLASKDPEQRGLIGSLGATRWTAAYGLGGLQFGGLQSRATRHGQHTYVLTHEFAHACIVL